MKSEDAEQKYCPFAMFSGYHSEECTGDKCMAWREDGNGDGYCHLI